MIDLNNTAELQAATEAASQIITAQSKAETPSNMILLESRRRSTTANPVPADQQYRAALLPESILQLPEGATSSKFAVLLQSELHRLAADKFAAVTKAQPMLREIEHASYSIDNVLAYWAEERQRQQITPENVETWLKQSATLAALPEQKRAAWLKLLPKIANKNAAAVITKDMAAVIVTKIADADQEHPTAVYIMRRCDKIMSSDEDLTADAL